MPFHHHPDSYPTVAHTLLRAREERVLRLTELWTALTVEQTDIAYDAVLAQVDAWRSEDGVRGQWADGARIWRLGASELLHEALWCCLAGDATDLGLGLSHAVVPSLELAEGTLERLVNAPADASLARVEPALSSYPWVPSGRFGVREERAWLGFPGAGAVGWCDADDLLELSMMLPDFVSEVFLHEAMAASARMEAAAAQGHYAIGCLELLTQDSEGRRSCLVARDLLVDASLHAG